MAKGHDPGIVRVLKLIQKLYYGSLKLDFVWSRAFKCSVKTCVTGLLLECLFHYHPIHVDPSTQQVMLVKGCGILKCYGLPVLSPVGGGLHSKSSRP
jgi:hypothetical protein